MANHPSAEKRNRQRIVRTNRNRAVLSAVRSHVKALRAAIKSSDKAAAKKALAVAVSALDRAASKGVIHRKAASRRIARLSTAVHKLA